MKNSTLLATVITPSPPSNCEIHPCFAGENPDNPDNPDNPKHPEQGISLSLFTKVLFGLNVLEVNYNFF